MASYDNDTVPLIVGACSAGLLVVVLIWYTFMRIKVHKGPFRTRSAVATGSLRHFITKNRFASLNNVCVPLLVAVKQLRLDCI